ncbi:MAG: hypothetical protein WAZ94_13405 [Phycisphaerales bacterium]
MKNLKTVKLLCWGRVAGDTRDTASSVVVVEIVAANPMAVGRAVDARGEAALEGVHVVNRSGDARIAPGHGVHVNYTPGLPASKARIRRAR